MVARHGRKGVGEVRSNRWSAVLGHVILPSTPLPGAKLSFVQ